LHGLEDAGACVRQGGSIGRDVIAPRKKENSMSAIKKPGHRRHVGLALVALAAAMVSGSVVLAHPTPADGTHHLPPHGVGGFSHEHHGRMLEHLTEALGLSDTQRASIQTLHEATHSKIAPLLEQQRTLNEQLQAELARGADAAGVGALVISLHRLGRDMKAGHEQLQREVEAVLDAEQVKEFTALKNRHAPHFGPHPACVPL
jgi:Spy/CpxP family protein refolding chaperone